MRLLSLMLLVNSVLAQDLPSMSAEGVEREETPDHKLQKLESGGRTRSYRVHLPAGLPKGTRVPLVLMLHGGSGTSGNTMGLAPWNELASRLGFIVVYPDGIDRQWNDGRGAHEKNPNDVGFIRDLLTHLESRYPIDGNRIYATGISNGGMMSHRLACELSDRIAAIAPVAGALPEPLMNFCSPSRKVPVLMINGTDDGFVTYDGRKPKHMSRKAKKASWVISVPQTVDHWVRVNGASPKAKSAMLRDLDPKDGTQVRRDVHAAGEAGAEVVLYTIENGGHTWPGGKQYLPEFMIGKTCRDMDGCEIIWEFFSRHSLKKRP